MPETTNSKLATTTSSGGPRLARRIGLFDGTMIVMGGIIGSGIFMNPHVVAGVVHTPTLILGAWAVGGLIALAGAFIYAELAALRPHVGGQYAYIREAFHPGIAFIYGWTLLLVVQSGGMAAVAVTFARYFLDLTHLAVTDWAVAAIALGGLTIINCLGVRAGSTVQSGLMVLKILAIAAPTNPFTGFARATLAVVRSRGDDKLTGFLTMTSKRRATTGTETTGPSVMKSWRPTTIRSKSSLA